MASPTAQDRAQMDLQEAVEAAINTGLSADQVREAVEDQIAWTVEAGPELAEDAALRSPKRIAEVAADHLCAYDAVGAPNAYEPTAERTATFLREFVLIAAGRLQTVARKESP